MKPFRTSPTARILCGAAAFSLISGGLVASFGIDPGWSLPVILLVTIVSGIVALVVGVNEHKGAVAMAALLLPLALWPYTMALIWITTRQRAGGPVLIAAGLVMLAAALIATVSVKPEPAVRSDLQPSPR